MPKFTQNKYFPKLELNQSHTTYIICITKNLQLTGKVQGFINEPRSYAYEGGVLGGSRRRFPVDMSGFAVHLSLIHTRSELGANIMPYHQPYQEEGFLNSLQLK